MAKVRGTMIFVLDLGISSVVISGPLGVGPRRTSADLGIPHKLSDLGRSNLCLTSADLG